MREFDTVEQALEELKKGKIILVTDDENRTIAEYALRDMSKPIGVSEYHLCTDLPLDLKDALPAVEDIRNRIDMKK